MGTRIEAAVTSHSRARRGPFARGALRLSDSAVRACLERGGSRASDLDLLVNAGLYKEHSMAEPALASIIQEDVGANTGRRLHDRDHGHGTFSFDVMNGGCGVVTALHLLDGFVGAGTARLALVVAADSDPEPSTTRGFPFDPVGGAILLRHVDGEEGFVSIETRTFPRYDDLFEVKLEWEPAEGRNVIEVREAPAFAERCVELAAAEAHAALARRCLRVDDVDVLVASQYPITFASDLAHALGLPEANVPTVRPELRRAHTAGPIAALEAAFDSGAFSRAKRILFVTAGAGITIGTAIYERRSEPAGG